MNSLDLHTQLNMARRIERKYAEANQTSHMLRDSAEAAQMLMSQKRDPLEERAVEYRVLGGHFKALKDYINK